MAAVDRAATARRWGLREIAIRSGGATFLGACALEARVLYRLENLPPAHEATALELLLAAAAFLTFACGLALLFHGGDLFEFVPAPLRNPYTGL